MSTNAKGRQCSGLRHLYIPDLQVKPDVPIDHIGWAARYAAAMRPDVIIQGGDWFDLPSLSSYDKGKMASEGRRYQDDIDAGNAAIELFGRELKKHAPRGYRPRKVVTLGNHENRLTRAIEDNAQMDGKLSLADFHFKQHGWETHPFLKPVTIHGVTYIHYCPLNSNGQVTQSKNGCPSALAQARRMMRSTVCGHKQGLDTAVVHTPGRTIRGIIAGSFYAHEEGYLTPCGETYWRGILLLNDVRPQTGEFDICEVSKDYLGRRFG